MTAPSAAVMSEAPQKSRIDSIDLLRGIVMVIMMLDHTRDVTHWASFQFDPTDLTHTYPSLFFTRWITHFCAPVFVFLAGTGAYIQRSRGKSISDLSRFLWTRGFWLIFLEFTAVRLGAFWNLDYHFLGVAQVIWVIGWSMVVLSLLIRLPLKAIAWFGVGMIVLHNLLDRFDIQGWHGPGTPFPGFFGSLWLVLHQPGVILPFGRFALVLYPLIPWIGVMAVGYAFGRIYDWDSDVRKKFLIRNGVAVTATFLVLRGIDFYGDPNHWAKQKTLAMTVVSFFNTAKYPPSLLFLCMTLGPAMLALVWFERMRNGDNQVPRFGFRRALIDFGRVPMFFYLLQWPTSHAIGLLMHRFAGKPTSFFFGAPFVSPPPSPGMGFSLRATYLAWLTGVLLLYPLCRWYANYKKTHDHWWLGYI